MGIWPETEKGGLMKEKITWHDIYKDFKIRLPHLSKTATYWKPRGYLAITVYCEDGSQIAYDYLYKKTSFIVTPQAALA